MIEEEPTSNDPTLTTQDLKAVSKVPEESDVKVDPMHLVAGQSAEPTFQGTEEEQVAGLGSFIRALSGQITPPTAAGPAQAPRKEAESILEQQAVGRIVDPARTPDRNFSLKYIGDETDFDEEVWRIMDNIAEEREFGSAAGMEAKSHEQTFETAQEVQVDVENFLGRKLNEAPKNAAELTAWRMMLSDSAHEVKDMAGKLIDANGKKFAHVSDADLHEFRQLLNTYAAMQFKFQGATKEVGRMLNAMKIYTGTDPLNTNTGELLAMVGGGEAGTLKLAKAIYQARTPEEIAQLAKGTMLQRWGGAGYEVWINGLLSGAGTHIKNVVGNSITAIQAVPEHLVAAGIGKMLGRSEEDRILAGEVNAMGFGLINGIYDGVRIASKNFVNGDGTVNEFEAVNASKLEYFRKPEFTAENLGIDENSWLGKATNVFGHWYVRLPGRVLEFEDDFFRAISYRADMSAQAYRVAYGEGLAPGSKEFNTRMNEVLLNPDNTMHMRSTDFSRYTTFTNQLEGSTSRAVQMFQTTPIGRLFLPFVRTPINILKYATARTPAAFILPSVRRDLASGGRKADLAMSRIATGTAMMGTFYAAYVNHDEEGNFKPLITGAPPRNMKMAELWREAGITPYSIYDKESGQYVPYNWAEPFGMQLSITADFAMAMNHATDPKQQEEVVAAFVSSIASYTTEKSYVQGFSQLMDILTNQSIGTFMRFPSSAVPSWLYNVRKDVDPGKRHTRTAEPLWGKGDMKTYGGEAARVLNYIQNKIPGLSDSLPMDTDVWGNDLGMGDPIYYLHSVSPVVGKAAKYEPATIELIQNNVSGREPGSIISVETPRGMVKVDITHMEDGNERFYEYRQLVGKSRLPVVKDVISSETYRNFGMPGPERQSMLDTAMSQGMSQGRQQFIAAYRKELEALAEKVIKNTPEYKRTILPGMEE